MTLRSLYLMCCFCHIQPNVIAVFSVVDRMCPRCVAVSTLLDCQDLMPPNDISSAKELC